MLALRQPATHFPMPITAESRRNDVVEYIKKLTKFREDLSLATCVLGAITVGGGVTEDSLILTLTYYFPSPQVTHQWTRAGQSVRGHVLFRVHFFISGRILLTDRLSVATNFNTMELARLYREIALLLAEGAPLL